MRKVIILSILFIAFLSLRSLAVTNSDTIVIKTNIYCDHCKDCGSCGGKIEKDLGFEKGIKLVKLDETAMTITVTYNPKKTSPEKIREKISKYGFDADEVKADPVAYDNLDECCKKK